MNTCTVSTALGLSHLWLICGYVSICNSHYFLHLLLTFISPFFPILLPYAGANSFRIVSWADFSFLHTYSGSFMVQFPGTFFGRWRICHCFHLAEIFTRVRGRIRLVRGKMNVISTWSLSLNSGKNPNIRHHSPDSWTQCVIGMIRGLLRIWYIWELVGKGCLMRTFIRLHPLVP